MKENVFENPVEVRAAVASPHFEDRRVVMRAQRVVPLAEIRTKVRLRKVLYLGGAFAIAVVLGAATALIAVHVQRNGANGASATQIQLTNNTPAETETTETTETLDTQDAAAAPVDAATDSTLTEEEAAIEPVVKPVVEPKRQTPQPQRPRIVASENQPLEPRDRGVEPSEEERLEQIRESILYDRWQERRARRAARRERRNRGDLSRVDELFEGPRRPERPY